MTPPHATHLRLSGLRTDAPTAFLFAPDPEETQQIRDRLDLRGLRKMRFQGEVIPQGRTDWKLTGHLGATITQLCSITLEPVTTRIEEPVARLYTKAFVAPKEGESEMPEDDALEPLPEAIDLAALAEEALALAIPPFPRAEGAEEDAPFQAEAAPPGADPLDAAAARENPFAALEGLKRKLEE